MSYLIMFVLAIFANFTVLEGLVESGDPTTTVANLTESIGLFRLGVLSFLVIAMLDLAITWCLHVVLRSVDGAVSLAAAWLRLAYSAVLTVGVASLYRATQLVGGSNSLGLSGDQLDVQIMSEVLAFESV